MRSDLFRIPQVLVDTTLRFTRFNTFKSLLQLKGNALHSNMLYGNCKKPYSIGMGRRANLLFFHKMNAVR